VEIAATTYGVVAPGHDRLVVPEPASADDIAERIAAALAGPDGPDVDVCVDLRAGLATIGWPGEGEQISMASIAGPGVSRIVDPDDDPVPATLPATLPADLADELAEAGWVYDSTTEIDPGVTQDVLLHPAGLSMEVTAGGTRHGARLVLDGLTADQAAAAIRAAGLTGGAR